MSMHTYTAPSFPHFQRFSEIGASPSNMEAAWRIAQGCIMTSLFIQLIKFKVVFAYVRFRTEWYANKSHYAKSECIVTL